MTKDDIIRMAREAGFEKVVAIHPDGSKTVTVAPVPELERFAALVAAAERNKLAQWMMAQGYATGHGDAVEGLLKELEWQVRESERERFYGQDKPAECADGCPPNQICDYCQVVAPFKAMILAEREACAKVCDSQEQHDDPLTAWKIAEAIRARGQA